MPTAKMLHDAYNASWASIPCIQVSSSFKIQKDHNFLLKRRTPKGSPVFYEIAVATTSVPVPNSQVREADAASHLTTLLSVGYSSGSVLDHKLAKADPVWQTLYQRAARNIPFRTSAGADTKASMQSYPCHYCGIILPEELIQVDHKFPQKGGRDLALLKVLHTILPQYTEGQAIGQKNTQLAAGTAPAPVSVKAVPWNHTFGTHPTPFSPAKLARYSLSPRGKTFLGLCTMMRQLVPVMEKSLNSIHNLVPACQRCNGDKSNKAFAQ
jgi:hypothetical protein